MKRRPSRKPMKDLQLELVRLGASKSQLAKPEIGELSNRLFSDEEVRAFVIGFYEGGYGMLVATSLRLLFIDVMIFGRVVVDDIPYANIGAVELQRGVFFGSVSVLTRPKNYRFWWLNKEQAADFNDYVERQMLRHHREDVRVD